MVNPNLRQYAYVARRKRPGRMQMHSLVFALAMLLVIVVIIVVNSLQ